jgi:hypothetical protein
MLSSNEEMGLAIETFRTGTYNFIIERRRSLEKDKQNWLNASLLYLSELW